MQVKGLSYCLTLFCSLFFFFAFKKQIIDKLIWNDDYIRTHLLNLQKKNHGWKCVLQLYVILMTFFDLNMAGYFDVTLKPSVQISW